jgi:hypothetical protein
VEARPAIAAPRDHRKRSLHMNIAVQRKPQKRLKPNQRKEISSQFVLF